MAAITYTSNTGFKLFGNETGAWMVDDTAETLVGSELVTNGGFATDTDWTKGTGWSIGSGVASCDGTQTASTELYQSASFTVGASYIITVDITVTAGSCYGRVSGASGHTITASESYVATIIATSASSTIKIVGDADFIGSVDNLTVRLAVPDVTANNNGLQVFGSITKAAVATGAESQEYSGFASANYLFQPAGPTYTGDFFFAGWTDAIDGDDEILTLGSTAAAGATDTCHIWANLGALKTNIGGVLHVSPAVLPASGRYFFAVWRSGSTLYTSINGVTVKETAGNTNTIDGSTNGLTIGKGYYAGFMPNAALFRTGAFALTAAQVKSIYESEKWLFKPYAKLLQVGSNYGLDIRYKKLDRSFKAINNKSISLNGTVETINIRNDISWDINTIPLLRTNGDLDNYKLMVESGLNGHVMSFDPYGSVASPDDPKDVYLDIDSYTQNREGPSEYYNLNFKLREK